MAKTYIEVATQSEVTELTETVTTVSETVDTINTSVYGTDDTDGLENVTEDLTTRVTALEDEATSAVTISAIYDTNTSMSEAGDDGYYIWTSEPADLSTYLQNGTVNDIWLQENSTWSVYQSYDDCMATIAVSAESDGEITYMKSEGSWIEAGTGSSTSVQITAIYDEDTNVATVTEEGYYIWTAEPTNMAYITDYVINDIAYYDGVSWELYTTYNESPATIYNIATASSYEKLDSEWVETVTSSSVNNREIDYGYFSLGSAVTLSGSGYYLPIDTEVKISGDVRIGTDGIILTAGRTYQITYFPYINNLSGSLVELYIYDYTSDSSVSTSNTLISVDNTSDALGGNVVSCIYTPSDDSEIGVYVSSSGTGNFYPNRNNIIVQEVPTDVVYYLPMDAYSISNDVTTAGQVLVSTENDSEVEWSDVSTRELDYIFWQLTTAISATNSTGNVDLASNTTIIASQGDISLTDDGGIQLYANRSYKLTFDIYITSNTMTYNIYSTNQDSTILPENTSIASYDVNSSNGYNHILQLIYKPDEDDIIYLYKVGNSSSGIFIRSTFSVVELPSSVTSFLDADDIEVDNAATASEGDILTATGSNGSATFVSTIDGEKLILTGTENSTEYYLQVDDTDSDNPIIYLVEV